MVMENLFGATYQANIKTLSYYEGDQLKDVTIHSTRESQFSTTFGSPDLIEAITVPDKISFPLISETEGTYNMSCTVDFMDNFLGKGNPYPTEITLSVDLDALTPILNTESLDAAIKTAAKYTQGTYTKESFKTLQDAVTAAKAALKSAQSQEELDAAAQKIESAIKNLKKLTVAAPTKVKAASAAYNRVKVSWNKVKDASGYEVYQYNSKTKKYSAIKTTTGTSYTKSGLKTGTKYVYKVRAYRVIEGKKLYSAYTAAVSAKPTLAKVTKVKAKNSAKKTANISWKKVDGASGYKLYRASKSSGKYKAVKTITKGKTVKYSNKKLKKGKKYYYKVRAYKTVSGKKIYGSYSSKASVKIKR